MNQVDVLFAVIIGISFVWGFRKGLIATLASLIGLILGVYCALNFSSFGEHYLALWFSWSARTISLVSFVSTFLVVVLAVNYIGKALTKILGLIALGLLNKMLGGLVYTLQMLLFFSFCIWLLNTQHLIEGKRLSEATQASRLYPIVEKLAPALWPKIKQLVKKEHGQEQKATGPIE